jgi:hypothetical protein
MQLAAECLTLDTSVCIVPTKEDLNMVKFGGGEFEEVLAFGGGEFEELVLGGGEAERAFGGSELEVGAGLS